ncbi:MAG: type II toxin-antitoxin system RelE/ParE family toxin [Candidatus Thiodiazotropha taylori]|nr:type II toxin-antitoxin system RelE/ParE family toxin [Candidatus Thiodiazotropha taylori]
MGSYKLSNKAITDLERIWLRGLREYGLEQADNYYNTLFDRFEELAENPFLYQAVDDICGGYRRSPCGVDAIYYRFENDIVEIMSIIGQQDTEN